MYVSDWMTKKVLTVGPDDYLSDALTLSREQEIKHIPVVKNGKLKGIISDRDIFHALVDITGVRHGGHRICVTIEDRPGSIREVAVIIRQHGFHLQGILTSYEGVREGSRKVVIRTTEMGDFRGLKSDLEVNYRSVQIRKG